VIIVAEGTTIAGRPPVQISLRKNSPLYGPERFTYLPESNSYLCPAGQQLNYGGHNARNRTHVYIGTTLRWVRAKSAMHQPLKYLAIHMQEPARQRARDLVHTPAFANVQRERNHLRPTWKQRPFCLALENLKGDLCHANFDAV
jgi:hypothetical protein